MGVLLSPAPFVGITLSDLLKHVGRMSEVQVAHILWQVGGGPGMQGGLGGLGESMCLLVPQDEVGQLARAAVGGPERPGETSTTSLALPHPTCICNVLSPLTGPSHGLGVGAGGSVGN